MQALAEFTVHMKNIPTSKNKTKLALKSSATAQRKQQQTFLH